MENAQEKVWAEAQKIELSLDTVDAAKRHLQFLSAVDKTAHLYDGPALRKAINRYNVCWLPLLAKHAAIPLCEKPIVVPLDCEWIWHCHRLNPVRYISDCKELFGRLLDNRDVVSSVEGYSKKQTEKIWSEMFPEEPYELDFAKVVVDDAPLKFMQGEKLTDYDLASAVERQSSFYWQVARPHMSNDIFLRESVARYKAFLYLMRRNMEKSATQSCVPTYDVDLIWHTHQLHPKLYCKDMIQLFGRVVNHDDTDSDRSEGKKLNVGFKQTTKQWEDTFGRSYWRAGAMYRGTPPIHHESGEQLKPVNGEITEMLVEFIGVKSLPEGIKKEDVLVTLNKKQPDMFFTIKEGRNLRIQSVSGEKEVALFWCEPTGELLFDLQSENTSSTANETKVLGRASLSLNELFEPVSELFVKRWIELAPPNTEYENYKPISLQVGVSFTVPTPATTQMLDMLKNEALLSKGEKTYGGGCGGKRSGRCKGLTGVAGGGCSGKCSGGCRGLIGVGGCSGKCSGGCKGLVEVEAGGCSGNCSGTCNGIFTVSAGGCSSNCSGTCNGIFTVSAGGCSGNCSGTCNGIFTVSAGGCSGNCSGTCNGIYTVSAGRCRANCSGVCNGIFTV